MDQMTANLLRMSSRSVLALFTFCVVNVVHGALPQRAPQEPAAVRALADRVAEFLVERTVQHCDERPSVRIGERTGYRFVLRRVWRDIDPKDLPQAEQRALPLAQTPTVLRNDDWEFVLFPATEREIPVSLKQKIAWRKSASLWHTRSVCAGTGHGFVWFTHHTIPGQHSVRKHLELKGGDNPAQLLVDGLVIEDQGTYTANSCCAALFEYGDDAVVRIQDLLLRGVNPWKPIFGLGHIRTKRATAALLELYDSDVEIRSRAAAYALISQLPGPNRTPYRPDAKRAYLDMIRRRTYVDAAAKACVQYGWKDALPLLRAIENDPESRFELRDVIHRRRELEGNPVAPELIAAEMALRTCGYREQSAEHRRKVDAARTLFIESQDSEVTNAGALCLALFTTKGSADSVRAMGIDILRKRPREQTVAFLMRAAVNGRPPFGNDVREVLKQIDPAAAQAAIGRGKTVRGLQSQIVFTDAPGHAQVRKAAGQDLRLHINVRNVSQAAIHFTTYSPSFATPVVKTRNGQQLAVNVPPYDGPVQIVDHTLQPNESVKLPLVTITVRDPEPSTAENYCLFASSGTYSVSYVLRLDSQHPGHWKGELSSGQLRLLVTTADSPFPLQTAPRAPTPVPAPR